MKHTPLRQVSKKQAIELRERSRLKQQFVFEELELRGYTYCQTCNRQINIVAPGHLELAHIIALSRGGKTTEDNCVLEGGNFDCGCSAKYEKRPEDRPIHTIGYHKYFKQMFRSVE